MYLPKEYSLFYIGEYDTIDLFFRNHYRIISRNNSSSINSQMRVDVNKFGNMILGSSNKLL